MGKKFLVGCDVLFYLQLMSLKQKVSKTAITESAFYSGIRAVPATPERVYEKLPQRWKSGKGSISGREVSEAGFKECSKPTQTTPPWSSG